MPISYQIDRARRLVVGRATGRVGFEDLETYTAALAAEVMPLFALLLDATDVVKVTLSKAQAESIPEGSLAKIADRRALLVQEPLVLGLPHLYRIHRASLSDEGFRVFLDRTKALAWLGVAD